MGIERRKLITAGLASAGAALAAPSTKGEKPVAKESFQLIDYWIIQHGGECCGCAITEDLPNNEYRIICNECGQELDILVSELTYRRMAEALYRASHALSFAHNQIVHDGKPEESYSLDFSKELKFIDETLKLADISPSPLEPLT